MSAKGRIVRGPDVVKLLKAFDRIDDDGETSGAYFAFKEISLIFSKRPNPALRLELNKNCASGRIVADYIASAWRCRLRNKSVFLFTEGTFRLDNGAIKTISAEPLHGFPL